MLPPCFFCRPSGDGGPYDVLTSFPGNGQLGSRRLEATRLELRLGFLVSAYHLRHLSLLPRSTSTKWQPSTRRLLSVLLPSLHPSSQTPVNHPEGWTSRPYPFSPRLPRRRDRVDSSSLFFVRTLSSFSADKATNKCFYTWHVGRPREMRLILHGLWKWGSTFYIFCCP